MKVNDVKKLLDESNSMNLISILIPSLKKEFKFKPITIGMRKTLSKFAISAESNIADFQIAKLGLIKSLCIENINENLLTEVDFICILASLRDANIMDDLKVKIHCNSCGNEFNHTINFNTIIDNCNNYKFLFHQFCFNTNNINYKFVLSNPSTIDEITLDKYIEQLNVDNKEIIRALNKSYLYIKEIYRETELIEDYMDMNILQRIQFLDESFDDEVFFGENGLLNTTQNIFNREKIVQLYGNVICPGCNKDLGGIIDSDNFFTI